jgi:hypothetical protein
MTKPITRPSPEFAECWLVKGCSRTLFSENSGHPSPPVASKPALVRQIRRPMGVSALSRLLLDDNLDPRLFSALAAFPRFSLGVVRPIIPNDAGRSVLAEGLEAGSLNVWTRI